MPFHSYLHINKNYASENSFPCNSQLKCKYLNIRGRMNSDHESKVLSYSDEKDMFAKRGRDGIQAHPLM
jgi:hypothetical protein